MESKTIELPCKKCGNAAVRVDLTGAVELVPKKFTLAAKGAARLAGKPLDLESPSLGLDPAEIAEVIGATCIACVDEENWRSSTLDDGETCAGEMIRDEWDSYACSACAFVDMAGPSLHKPVPPNRVGDIPIGQ